MSNNYFCPICRSNMSIGNSLVFSAKSPENKRGLLLLDTELGNYTKRTHPDFQLEEGVEYKFYCPVCHAKLNKEDNTNLVLVHMTDGEGKDLEIYISNIIGEHCTYKIKDRSGVAFGSHVARYVKYLDVPMEDRKYL